MRVLAIVMLAAGMLLSGMAPASAASSITGPRVVLVQDRGPLVENKDQGRRPVSSTDMVVRMVYAALGASAGYMYATMPVTTTAIAAAFAGGVITMWVYSSYYTSPEPLKPGAQAPTASIN